MEAHKKCKGCNKYHDIEQFMYKEKERKCCLKCYQKCINNRKKKKEQNKEAYLRHNAAMMKTWRDNNKDHVKKWRMQNVNYMLHAIKGQSKKKEIPWLLTDEQARDMMTQPCEYCGYIVDEHVNGIDRKNNNDSYNVNNCVPCCKHCNFLKKALDPQTFIERCFHISYCHGGVGQYNQNHTLWASTKNVAYNAYKQRADKNDWSFELSQKQFNDLICGSCVYCGRPNDNCHNNGIDRKQNNIGYTEENCVPCCGECNLMKANMSYEQFIDCVKKVAGFCINLHIEKYQDIPRCNSVLAKRKIEVGNS